MAEAEVAAKGASYLVMKAGAHLVQERHGAENRRAARPGQFSGTFTGAHKDAVPLPSAGAGAAGGDVAVREGGTTVRDRDRLVAAHNAMLASAPQALTFQRLTHTHGNEPGVDLRKRHGCAARNVAEQCEFQRQNTAPLDRTWETTRGGGVRLGDARQVQHRLLVDAAVGRTPLCWL